MGTRAKPAISATLDVLASELSAGRWQGMRGRPILGGALRRAIKTLCELLGRSSSAIHPADVRPEHVAECVRLWRERDGLGPATINFRLTVLSSVGIDCAGNWRTVRLPPKWWLKLDDCDRLLTWLRGDPEPMRDAAIVADYVEFVTRVGLRVEETLRLKWADVSIDLQIIEGEAVNQSEITVPGTKTAGAQASLAISVVPALLLKRRFEARAPDAAYVFPIRYELLAERWLRCRSFLGVEGNPLSTLRALRRTAARHLTTRGMPTDIVRQYLRHSQIETTMGYLRLVGGYSTAEQRRWL
jgi:integrase